MKTQRSTWIVLILAMAPLLAVLWHLYAGREPAATGARGSAPVVDAAHDDRSLDRHGREIVASPPGVDTVPFGGSLEHELQAATAAVVGEARVAIAAARPAAAKVELHGRITDESGAPLRGVAVYANRSTPDERSGAIDSMSLSDSSSLNDLRTQASLETDENGEFGATRLAPGRYVVQFTSAVAESPGTREVELAPGAASRALCIVMRTASNIQGTVVDIDGRAVTGTRLRLERTRRDVTEAGVRLELESTDTDEQSLDEYRDQVGKRVALNGVSHEDGSFCIVGVPAGHYSLHAQFGTVPMEPRRVDVLFADVADVTPGAKDVRIVMPHAGVIEGIVLDAEGRECAGVYVSALNAHGNYLDTIDTDKKGHFRVRVGEDDVVELSATKTESRTLARGRRPEAAKEWRCSVSDVRAGSRNVVLRLSTAP
jgi:hypothetical protein